MLLEIVLPQKGMSVENGYMKKTSMHVLFVNDKHFDNSTGNSITVKRYIKFFDNVTEKSITVKRYVCRRWLHGGHIHACSLCER